MKKILSTLTVFGAVFLLISVTSDLHAAQTKTQRFVDNGDGTITDNQTGLMWEKKTGTIGVLCLSTITDCSDPTNVNNRYSWTSSGTAPDGTLFTDFLPKMNCAISSDRTCGPGVYNDWRIPTIAELRTILTAEAPNCTSSPCIDPIFGPTYVNEIHGGEYWTSTSWASGGVSVWEIYFANGFITVDFKYTNKFARAVRGGR